MRKQEKATSVYLTALLRIVLGCSVLWLVGCKRVPVPAAQPSGTPAATDGVSKPASTMRPTWTPTVVATGSPTKPAATLDVQGIDLDGVIIQFWHPWRGSEAEHLQQMLDAFTRSNAWGLKAEARAFEGMGRLEEALREAVLARQLPQIITGYTYQGSRWDVGGKILVDLDPYINDPEWGLKAEEQKDFYHVFWEQDYRPNTSQAEKRLGVPFSRSAQLVFYNHTWAEELGYSSPPGSILQFKAQACAAAKANSQDDLQENDGRGGWLITPDAATLVSWIYVFGGEIVPMEGQGYQFRTPQGEQALVFMKTMLDEGCAWYTEGVSPQEEFASRRALFWAGSLEDIPVLLESMQGAPDEEGWTVLPFPREEGQPVIDVFGASLMMLQTSPEEQLGAWLVMKWLLAPENQARWADVTGNLPVRASAFDLVVAKGAQWEAAAELLLYARLEPGYASWSVVQWAVSDALAQVLSPRMKLEQVGEVLEELDRVAEEIHAQVR